MVNILLCALKGQSFHSPEQRPGYKMFMCNAPCKGSFNIPSLIFNIPSFFFRVALTAGRFVRFFLFPRALPWAVEAIGLSARPCHVHLVLLTIRLI